MPRLLLGSDPNGIGEHNLIFFNGLRVPYAWVMNDGLSYVTTVFSHPGNARARTWGLSRLSHTFSRGPRII